MERCWWDGRVLSDGTESMNSTPSRLVADEYGYSGPDMVLCLVCANNRRRYDEAVSHAKGWWWKRG